MSAAAAQELEEERVVRRSRYSLLSFALLMGLFLSACSGGGGGAAGGGQPTPSGAPTSAAPVKPTPEQQTGTPAAAVNPDIAVNVQYLDWRVFTEKLIAAHAGGVLPDIYQAGAEYVAPLATKGMALDIDTYIASWGQRDDFYDSAWSTVSYQGKTYG